MNENAPCPAAPTSSGTPRHRRRGRVALFATLGLAFVLALGASQAFGHGPFRHRACGPMDPAEVGKKIDRVAGWIVEDLGGTPDQEAKLAGIAKAAAKDLAPIHEELVAGRRLAAELLTAKEIDRKALEAHRARQLLLLDEASVRLASAVADAAEVLTPEQRAKAAERLASHMARFGH